MVITLRKPSEIVESYIDRLLSGQALLDDSPENLIEVVGILDSYGEVLNAYSINLCYIADHQFLLLFPFFKYFNGEVTFAKLKRYLWHDRINYEYAEYCMKTMLWHGGGGLDAYLDTPEFVAAAKKLIEAKIGSNPFMVLLNKLFPEFLVEQLRQSAYYSGLGQFWRVMSDIFISLRDRYNRGEITSIPQVVQHIQDGLVAAAANPISYVVECRGETYELIPQSAGLTFIADTAVPYVEAIFFRGTPFPGTVSYNAQAYQIPYDQSIFNYGALYADPLPVGGAGIPPTLLMHDMGRFLPPYLEEFYNSQGRRQGDLLVKICQSFQKSMFCVTTAAIRGLAPHPLDTDDPQAQQENYAYLKGWIKRMIDTRMIEVNSEQ